MYFYLNGPQEESTYHWRLNELTQLHLVCVRGLGESTHHYTRPKKPGGMSLSRAIKKCVLTAISVLYDFSR